MIEIDGSYEEAGGQILRTALALSALTQKPFKIINIRAKRDKPGLREQHLQTVKAVKKLCNANISKVDIGVKELEFIPNEITKRNLNIKIRTAGSIALVLQSLIIASIKHNLTINIEGGGTFNKWAPSVIYLEKILLPLLNQFDFNSKIEIKQHGFYPKGGGKVEFKSKFSNIKQINLEKRLELKNFQVISIASKHLEKAKVADRQASSAKRVIGKSYLEKIKAGVQYVNALCPGSGILSIAEFENTLLGYDVIGEKGKQSEKIGEESAINLLKQIQTNACIDEFMIDQILPFMALAEKNSKVKVLELTNHSKTNIWVIEQFLSVKFKFNNNILECIQKI